MRSEADFRPEQRPAIDFIYRADQTLLLADVGTGKSVMALTAMQWWIQEGILSRALVCAPKRVCLEVWLKEPDDWAHLDADVLAMVSLAGRTIATRRKLIADTRNRILLINYENLPWLINEYPNGIPSANVLVFDEIDKMQDHATRRFRGRSKTRKDQVTIPATLGMNTWRDHFEIHVGMTGTPMPNHLLDLWGQMFMIDGGARLGGNFLEYRAQHFYQSDWAGYKFEPLPGRAAWIEEQIADVTYRVEAPTKNFPEMFETPVRWVDMPPTVRKAYREIEREYILRVSRKHDPDEVIAVDSAGVLYGKLKQMAQGFLYVGRPDDPPPRDSEWLYQQKYRELADLISELQGQQLMIIYHYQEQLAELRRRWPQVQSLGGGITDRQASQTMAAWNAGELALLALHPMAAGHGINIQHSGAHHIVMMTLPESAGLYTQTVGRLVRGGNPAGRVYVHRILARDTVDAERDDVVHGKIDNQAALLRAMKARQ